MLSCPALLIMEIGNYLEQDADLYLNLHACAYMDIFNFSILWDVAYSTQLKQFLNINCPILVIFKRTQLKLLVLSQHTVLKHD